MCGITGFIGEPFDATRRHAVLESMTDTLIHRGPDSAGLWDDGTAALGMRRLRIIDLDTGDPPILNEDQTVVVVYNGEIYNYKEIRRGLEARGHRFRTRSDTEVIVHLWEERGAELVHDLRGMFAIALWDQRKRSLLLARDRLGIKPLYWAQAGSVLLFGSEPKAIRAFPGFASEPDPRGLNAYLRLGFVPDPLSAFRGIQKLPPAHVLELDARGMRTRAYWRIEPDDDRVLEGTEAAAAVRELLTDSVSEELVSDVPLGAFLSGGIDSTAVVGAMRRAGAADIQTFSIGLDDPDGGELPFAREAASLHRTRSHEEIVRPDLVSLIPKLLSHLDEPLGDPSAIPTYLVSGLARRQVTVALTGDGGDEIFGGYNRYAAVLRYGWVDRLPAWLRRGAFEGLGRIWPNSWRGARLLPYLARTGMDRNLDHLITLGRQGRDEDSISGDLVHAVGGETAEHLLEPHIRTSGDLLTRMMYLDLKTYLPGDVLAKVDRMSMAHSLEVRVPLLDHRLVELAFTRVSRRFENGIGKPILRAAADADLPPSVRRRGKTGFGLPIARWLRGPLRPMLEEFVSKRGGEAGALLREGLVENLAREHLSGRDHSARLWSLLTLELWLRGLRRG